MESIKVKVNNETESREVQELFFYLGCCWQSGENKYLDCGLDVFYILLRDSTGMCYCAVSEIEGNSKNTGYGYFKTITIQQLKDMVVLKRNSIVDATHGNALYSYVKLSDGWYYFDEGESNKWIKSVGGSPSYYENLKPIERKEMKDFLVKYCDKWALLLLDSDTRENSYCVAVPSGADVAYFFSASDLEDKEDEIVFYKNSLNFIFQYDGWDVNTGDIEFIKNKGRIIWKRSETESVNDQYAEIEKLRQETFKVTIDELKHRVYKKDVSHLDFIDVYRVLELFNVQSHAVGHAIKKLLCSGGRGAKDEAQDIQEAIDSLVRYQEMEKEDYVLFDS